MEMNGVNGQNGNAVENNGNIQKVDLNAENKPQSTNAPPVQPRPPPR